MRQSATRSSSHFIGGEWIPPIRAALDRFLEAACDRSPLAVLDWDNTCIYNDIGEAVFFDLVASLDLRFDLDAFWEITPASLGRDALRTLWRAIAKLPPERRLDHADYREFRARFGELYIRTIEAMGPGDAYAWSARLLCGLTPQQIVRRSQQVIERELDRPLGESIWDGPDGIRLIVPVGIRFFRPIADLIHELAAAGCDVWIVSASPHWVVVPFAERLGIPAARVIGIRTRLADGRLTSEIVPPVTFREGKVAAIERTIGRKPDLAIGDTYTDVEMLSATQAAGGIAILLDRGDETLRRIGERSGWFVQPRWKPCAS